MPQILEEGRPYFPAWEHWQTLNYFARPGGMALMPILLSEALALMAFYDEPKETLDHILAIERRLYPEMAHPKGKKDENED